MIFVRSTANIANPFVTTSFLSLLAALVLFLPLGFLTMGMNVAEGAIFCPMESPTRIGECKDYANRAACQTANGGSPCVTKDQADRAERGSSTDESSWWDIGGHLKDFANWLIGKVLAVFIAIAGGLLALVGIGFDKILDLTVVNFGSTFKLMEGGVNAAWAGFRDIANILMIAMFVFVAFAVILNSQTYGLKQFGVRILIVAVLINFSLFFTKAIVDVSNVTAAQFRKSIEVKSSDGNDAGISAAFMKHSGLSTAAYVDASERIKNIAKTDWGNAFLYTFTTVIFYSALLMVLLYGLILLVTRMVVLIVLMVTSAAAFTAYMVPKGQQWWDKWWDALIRNALFAPLFMMMLWATVNIVKNLGDQALSFENLAKDASSWTPVLNMMIIVGLLYASTKVSSELSTLGGNFAKKWSAKGFSTALRATGFGGALGLLGRAGRSTFGRTADMVANSDALKRTAAQGAFMQRMLARGALAASGATAKASFDFRDSKIAKNLEKATGGLALGKGVGSYDSYVDKEAKYLADAAGTGDLQAVDTSSTRGTPPEMIDQTNATKKTNEEGFQRLSEGIEELQGTLKSHGGSGESPDQTPRMQAAQVDIPTAGKEGDGSKAAQNEIKGEGQDIARLAEQAQEEGRQRQLDTIQVNNLTAGSLRADSVPSSEGGAKQPTEKELKDAAKKTYVENYRTRKGRFGEDGPGGRPMGFTPGGVGNTVRRLINPSARGTQYTRDRIAKKAGDLIGKTKETERLEKIEKQLGDTKKGVDKLGDN